LIDAGHSVRGTTRHSSGLPALEAAGVEPFVGDPDRVGTILPALQQVAVVCLLLGSAVGDPDRIAALHSSRLEMVLEKMIDTTVRGLVYEATGTVAPEVLGRGAELVAAVCLGSRIPYALILAEQRDHRAWLGAARAAVEAVVG
jgi:uncharacterized protein YbjT (DUF2867 family)